MCSFVVFWSDGLGRALFSREIKEKKPEIGKRQIMLYANTVYVFFCSIVAMADVFSQTKSSF